MSRKKNKKKKIRIKKLTIIILVTILLLITSSIVLYLYNQKMIKEINNHYNKYTITTKKTTLYDKNNHKLGTISKDFSLELSKPKITNFTNKYFNIKDTDYYIYYEDLKKAKKLNESELDTNYLVFNKNINTTHKTTLSKDNKEVLTINKKLNLPIEYMDKDNYYVYYLNNILSIKKDKSIKEVDHENTKEKQADYVSVIHYEQISDNCNNYNCININSLKEQITKLKENNYHTISLEEYKNYLNKFANLKDKAILITTSDNTELVDNLNTELNINIQKLNGNNTLNFISSNKKTSPESNLNELDRYQIKSYTTIDNLLKMASGEEVIENPPVVKTNQGIAVLNYHFFYDSSPGEECDESICLEVSKFREHLEYLKNNNFKVLTMNEFTKWMYGEIELPEKSVLITVDDGAKGTGAHNGNKLIPLLEEYKLPATLFLIAGWWDISNYQSPYLTIQSHTYDMHQYGSCGRGQINCATYEEAKADLQKSLDIIGNKDSFCFPFYMYSDTSIQAVKDIGFRIAFGGGNRKATRNSNKYLIPRYPIQADITMEQFKNIVN